MRKKKSEIKPPVGVFRGRLDSALANIPDLLKSITLAQKRISRQLKEVKKRPITVATHSQLVRTAVAMQRHLKKRPKDGVLLMINPVRAIEDLGFLLSPSMKKHVRHVFGAPSGKDRAFYDAVKAGKKTLPLIKKVTFASNRNKHSVKR